jgi:hypothetical protein
MHAVLEARGWKLKVGCSMFVWQLDLSWQASPKRVPEEQFQQQQSKARRDRPGKQLPVL